jgi:hypothetical protein
MKTRELRRLKNKYYIQYYMIKAGNDNPILKKEMLELRKVLAQLEAQLK